MACSYMQRERYMYKQTKKHTVTCIYSRPAQSNGDTNRRAGERDVKMVVNIFQCVCVCACVCVCLCVSVNECVRDANLIL